VPGFLFLGYKLRSMEWGKTQPFREMMNSYEAAVGVPLEGQTE